MRKRVKIDVGETSQGRESRNFKAFAFQNRDAGQTILVEAIDDGDARKAFNLCPWWKERSEERYTCDLVCLKEHKEWIKLCRRGEINKDFWVLPPMFDCHPDFIKRYEPLPLRPIVYRPYDAGELNPPTPAPQQAQSAPIVQVIGDYVTGDKVMGNKTEQIGIKGDNNTVGGSISQNVGKQDTPKKSRFGRKIIEGVIVGVIVAIIAFFLKAGWQNLQSNKPPAEESLSSETPLGVTPEE